MELDDLKHQWHKADKTNNPKNQNIMEIIQNERRGPLASLKKSFKRQIMAMLTVPIFIIATNIQHIEKTLSSGLFWFTSCFVSL